MTAERVAEIAQLKARIQKALKGKSFTALSGKDKDALLEAMAKILGLIV